MVAGRPERRPAYRMSLRAWTDSRNDSVIPAEAGIHQPRAVSGAGTRETPFPPRRREVGATHASPLHGETKKKGAILAVASSELGR